MLGAATASHQVEGDNRSNDWWEFERAGRLPYQSGEACRHFELYESDFDLAHSWHHNAHRLSIEWSRIEPAPGQWNREALEHYARVIDALRQRGMEPLVTLHHFTNPAWFMHRGGWERADSVKLFRRYVDYVAARLSRDVKFWISVNEPTVYMKRAYVIGDWPPCKARSWLRALLVLRNLCRAHVVAHKVLHQHRADVMVGFSHSAPYVEPCNPRRLSDRCAAWMRNFVLNRLCMLLMGRSPRRVLDFIGINYYVRQIARWAPAGAGLLFGVECMRDHHGKQRCFSPLGGEVFAPGLRLVLREFSRFGVPLIVTENGIATDDETQRCEFLAEHLKQLAAAVTEGVDVRGYFYWTLFDNFEWALGYNPHFGLAAIDRRSQQRIPRPVAALFASICENHRSSIRSPL